MEEQKIVDTLTGYANGLSVEEIEELGLDNSERIEPEIDEAEEYCENCRPDS